MKIRRLRNLPRKVLTWISHNRKTAGIIAATGIFILLVVFPVMIYAYFARDLGTKEAVISRNDGGVTLLDRNERPFFTFYEAKNKDIVPLEEISEHMQHAVIASEDKDFYNHPGFSIRGILRSFTANIRDSGISQGGSTITQQLVKNVLLSPERSITRKYQEIVLAIEIDRRYSKDDILEMYLNSVYFGEGAFGVEQAAKTYFGKDAADLTIAESAMLAGVLPAPSAYSPVSGDRTKANSRQRTVLKLMEEQGYITAAERKAAEGTKLDFEGVRSSANALAPHFAIMVKDRLIEMYGENALARSGYKVKTTLNADWQRYSQQAVENQISALKGSKASNGALVAIDPDSGEILTMVGSHDWYDETNGRINMATRPRQPGSSFKPLVYATAIDNRLITAGTVFEDKERDFGGGYRPRNYDRRERGPVTVRRALANSLNITAVEIMQEVGVNTMLDKAESLGITTLDDGRDYGLSLVLGSGEVPLLEMTGAFSTFANEGVWTSPHAILEVRDKKDRVVYTAKPDSRRVFSENTSYIISSILSDARARAETFGGALTISRQAAVKTGTTEDYRDALTIGYTPQVVVGVWVGNNDNTPMGSVAGSLGAAPIWRNAIQYFLADEPVRWFEKPSGVSDRYICIENGLLLEQDQKDSTSSATLEYYIRGTEPDK
jgi:1A family penicillin-binding protein